MKKLEWITLTIQEVWEALKMPTPVKNKKKYTRKTKHKGIWFIRIDLWYFGIRINERN